MVMSLEIPILEFWYVSKISGSFAKQYALSCIDLAIVKQSDVLN